jgi:hypothetical protein
MPSHDLALMILTVWPWRRLVSPLHQPIGISQSIHQLPICGGERTSKLKVAFNGPSCHDWHPQTDERRRNFNLEAVIRRKAFPRANPMPAVGSSQPQANTQLTPRRTAKPSAKPKIQVEGNKLEHGTQSSKCKSILLAGQYLAMVKAALQPRIQTSHSSSFILASAHDPEQSRS